MASDEALALLRSIDASLKKLVAQGYGQSSGTKSVASDRQLDGKGGDPEVRFNPRDWTGPSCKGRTFSQCPADFLDLLAETFDYFAGQAEEKNELTERGRPVAEFKRRDASLARGWAKRIRDGKHKPQTATSDEWTAGDGF